MGVPTVRHWAKAAHRDGRTLPHRIIVVAATNYPDAIDPAVTRPGRIGESLEVPPPDAQGRRAIFRIQTRGIPTRTNVTPAWFATTTADGMTGADIAAIVEQALHRAIRESAKESGTPSIERGHIQSVLQGQLSSDNSEQRGYH